MTSMTPKVWRYVAIGAALLILILGSVATCHYNRKGVSGNNQATIDSLRITQPTFDSSRAATLTTERTHTAAAATHGLTVTRLTTAASREHIAADSLARLAIAAVNDAIKWRDAYYAQKAEADSLRLALAAANARADQEQGARIEADRRSALDSARNVALQKLALGLEADANKAANCRVAYVIPCATRTQTFIVGGILGAAATYVAVSRVRP
jgi:hypothetical protein